MPPGWPRTKPRALNVGLALARGRLLTVYDAEDVPEPDQLRKAAALFAVEPPTTACLQGRLVIDDHADGLLPKLFAAEYAGLFDVLNPALCALDLPVPLGGTEGKWVSPKKPIISVLAAHAACAQHNVCPISLHGS